MHTTSKKRISISAWKEIIASKENTLTRLIEGIYEKAEYYKDYNIWIHLVPKEKILERIRQLERMGKDLPLFGVPFAVKDNIDVAGIPTTAACPAFSYVPEQSADVVKLLEDAGAIMMGKTNLDQFATGLVGTRSPYGAVKNSYDPEYISGGSSSGSAVAVALGLVGFSLGTDTAGSGRIPAGFNNLIGLKPSKGLISTKGVVPACKTLDCVSIFTNNCEDAEMILEIAMDKQWDKNILQASVNPGSFTFAVPKKEQLNFFGNTGQESLYRKAVDKLTQEGGSIREIDFTPFLQTAQLLYEGPWVAERLASIKDFYEKNSDALLPEIKSILSKGEGFSAIDTFSSLYRLEELKVEAYKILENIDFLFVPTAPTIYKINEIAGDLFKLNSNLGYYTNFVNLLDLSALAVPNGFLPNGLPMGVTLIAHRHMEKQLLQFGRFFDATLN